MVLKLKLTGARANESADNVTLTGADETGQGVELEFNEESAETLLIAISSVLGQNARRKTGNPHLKRFLPFEWWEINPHPAGDGLLLTFRIVGGLEANFHLNAEILPRYEEVLRVQAGLQTAPIPPGLKN